MPPLREKFIRDLSIRGYSLHTQRAYVGVVYQLAKFYRQAPDGLSQDQIQGFLYELARNRNATPSTLNVAISALRVFYRVTVGRSETEVALSIPRAKPLVKSLFDIALAIPQPMHRFIEIVLG